MLLKLRIKEILRRLRSRKIDRRTQGHRKGRPILKEFGRKPGLSYDGRGLLSVHSPHPPSPFPSLTWRRVAGKRMPSNASPTHRKNRNQFLLTPDHYCFFYESKRRGGHAVEEEKKVVVYNGSGSETYGRKATRKSCGWS